MWHRSIRKTLASLRGYLDVAHRLGHAAGRDGSRAACGLAALLYRGEIAEKETKILTAVFAAGLLAGRARSGSEPRQCGAVAQAARHQVDRGIAQRDGFVPLVDDGGSDLRSRHHKAAATIFGQHMPRLVSLDDRRLEAYLDGRLLVFRHHDVPGIIGAVGTIFGRHNVNIAQMAVGRDAPGGEAVGVLNLDGEPSAEALAEVRQLPAITSAIVIRLPPAGQLPSWLQG